MLQLLLPFSQKILISVLFFGNYSDFFEKNLFLFFLLYLQCWYLWLQAPWSSASLETLLVCWSCVDYNNGNIVSENTSVHTSITNQCTLPLHISARFFRRCFRDPIRVSSFENRVPRIRQNYHRLPAGPYQVPNIFLKKKLHQCTLSLHISAHFHYTSVTRVFIRYFRDPIRVPRIENRVPRIRQNYHRVPRIREISCLQVHTG